jgi:hypothetical protein
MLRIASLTLALTEKGLCKGLHGGKGGGIRIYVRGMNGLSTENISCVRENIAFSFMRRPRADRKSVV